MMRFFFPKHTKLLTLGNPILRQRAQQFTLEEIQSINTKMLLKDMRSTMQKENGCGLAAPQIGISKQLLLVNFDAASSSSSSSSSSPNLFAFFNPHIEYPNKTSTIWSVESCLSLPGLVGKVPRHPSLVISYLNEEGKKKMMECKGFFAAILQHETDHLAGILYIDRLASSQHIGYREESLRAFLSDPSVEWNGSFRMLQS